MPFAPRLSATLRVLTAGLSLLLFAALLPAAPASAAAKGVALPATFFGTHDSNPVSWPRAPFGSLRIWDSGVAWNQVETAPNAFTWTALDAQVRAANLHHAQVTLVLGQTPSFYATGVVQPGRYGAGAANMPQADKWTAYVRAVAARYRGKIAYLQVWNEANVVGYWSGSASQMAQLTLLARRALTAEHSTMKLIAPAMVVRSGRAFIDSYFAQRPSGHTINSLVDVVSMQLYPATAGGPEDSLGQLAAARAILRKRKVTKPIWNTEVNYGLAAGGTGARPKAISGDRQAAYVIRTFLLNGANGVGRVFWYSWDAQTIANTVLSNTAGTPTLAGKAVGVTRGWVAGSRLQGCSRAARGALKGTYTCTLSGKAGVKRVYWNPTRTVKITTAKTATYRTDLYGKKVRVKGGSKLAVNYRPVLVRSAR